MMRLAAALAAIMLASTVLGQIPGPIVPSGQGVNIHFTKARPGEMDMLARGGFGFVRMDFVWSATERERGIYDFSAYDGLMQDLAKHDIRPIFILDYTNAMYDNNVAPHTPEGRDAFARWAAAAAKHFAGKGVLWEMWNEPNIPQFWKPQPNVDDYAQLALTVGKALREAAPGETYVGPAASTIDLPFLEGCFKAGLLEYWSAVTVHPYRGDNPETVAGEYLRLRILIDHYKPAGKRVPIISGEWGYAVNGSAVTADIQANYLARQWLVNLSCHVPLSIWYDWHDDGENPKDPECCYGTVTYAYREGQKDVYEPKPAYLAAQTFVSQLRGYQFNMRLALQSQDDWLLLFTKGSDVKLVAWTVSPSRHSAMLPTSAGKFRLNSVTGRELEPATADATGLKVELSGSPVYVTPETPNEYLTLLANWTALKTDDAVRAPVNYRPTLEVKNTTGRTLKLFVGTDAGVELAPGAALATGTDYRVLRSEHPMLMRQQLRIEGYPVAYQESYLTASNPVVVTAMPAMGLGQIPIRIEVPAGEPVVGTLKMKSPIEEVQNLRMGSALREQMLVVPAGRVNSPLGVAVNGPYTVALALTDKDGAPIVEVPGRKYVPIPLDLTSYSLVPDGDAKVASEQTAKVVPAPEGLPVAGVQAMQVAYRFSAGWKFIRLNIDAPALQKMDGHPLALGMWIYGDGSGNSPRMRFVDSTNQYFQPTAPELNYRGWRYVEFPLRAEGAGRWGGANDGVIHYPIRLDTLVLIDGVKRQECAGTIYITTPTLIYPVDSVR